MPVKSKPKPRSAPAKDLATPKYHQRVVPDKRQKQREIDAAWAEHNAWKARGERD